MTTLAALTFDGDTEGVAVSEPAGWETLGATAIARAAAAADGAMGARWADTGSFGRLQYDTGSNQSVLVLTAHLNFRAASSANHYFCSVNSLPTGGAMQGDIRRNTSGTLSIRNGYSAVDTSTETLSVGSWYTFEWMLDTVADTQDLRVYEFGSTTPLFTLTGAWSSDTSRVVAVGPNIAGAGGAFDFDTVKVSDDWTIVDTPPATSPERWLIGAGGALTGLFPSLVT